MYIKLEKFGVAMATLGLYIGPSLQGGILKEFFAVE
jgi:hypothetical protein